MRSRELENLPGATRILPRSGLEGVAAEPIWHPRLERLPVVIVARLFELPFFVDREQEFVNSEHALGIFVAIGQRQDQVDGLARPKRRERS